MNTHRYLRLTLIALVTGFFTSAQAAPPPVTIDNFPVHSTRILARYNPEQVAQGAGVLNQQGLGVLDQSQLVPGLVTLDLADANDLAAAAAQPVETLKKELLRRIDALRVSGLFQYVEPDYLVEALAVPTDSSFTDGTLWGLRNTGQSGGVSGVDIGAVTAWDITTGSSNIIVAVIDTGIRYSHQDLAAQMWTNPGEIAGNGIDDDSNGYVDDVFGMNAITGSGNPFDDNDHGTHCSGTIGAMANGGGGHVGVAWRVRLMGCKFLSATGSGSISDAIDCIDYATIHGAKIMNNSWGGGGFSQALFDSIFAARNAGVLFVAAAGNDNSDNDVFPSYPAGYQIDNVVSVAAIDRTGARASFSNYGRNSVHLGAPGVAIHSSTADSDTSYALFNGTSMATPHVAGVAALLFAQFPSSPLAEIRQRLLAGTVPTASLVNTATGGRVNAFNSLTVAADGILEVAINPASGTAIDSGSNVVVRATVTDLSPVTNATVTATDAGGINYVFLNNGTAPDTTANDHVYSRNIPIAVGATNVALTLVVTAPGKVPKTNNVVYTFVVRPTNDNFIDRIVLVNATNSTSGANSNATKEVSEPLHAGNSGGKSVWWSWTAPSNGVAVVDTIGSSFDTILGVYTGATVSGLTTIASDDDGGGGLSSKVTFSATAGVAYRIAVDGFSGSIGQIQLHVGIGSGGSGLTLPEALDANSLTWTTGGNASWSGQTLTTHDGIDAGKSGTIFDNQESWMQTTVTGPGPLTFWWQISSEIGYDFLEFYIDGVLQTGRISGTVNWEQKSFDIGSGTHTLRWRYMKDGSVTSGQDAAWVDQVTFASGPNPSGSGVYLRSSVGSPWGTTANESAMDMVFGVSTWQNLVYETVVVSNLFTSANRVIFMEGSDNNATEMEAFLTAHMASLQTWVSNGGGLFLNAAPNENNGMNFGFGISLVYDSVNFTERGNAVALSHPIFNGPFLPVGTNWTGLQFAHATVTGTGLVPLISNSSNSLSVVGEKTVGAGRVLFGGMTVDSFHSPQPNAHNLRANILSYLNGVSPPSGGAIVISNSPVAVPYPSSLTISGISNTVTKVTVTLSNINHTWPDDLDILLVGPNGQKAILLSDAGGSAALTNVTLVFDDTAPQLPDAGPIASGTYRPTDYETGEIIPSPAPVGPYPANLTGFNGVSPNGVWSLFVSDDFPSGDNGVISGWRLNFTTASGPTIVVGPQSQMVSLGADVALNVTATGPAPLSYQWRLFGTNLPGSISSNLFITNIQPSQAGRYSVVVSNPSGSTPSADAVISLFNAGLYMGLVINGPIGANYRIDYQTSIGGAWQTLTTVALPSSPYLFIDPTPANVEQRFYRAVYLP